MSTLTIKNASIQADRFREMKQAARKRMDLDELTHRQFLGVLLDVYDFHLNGGPELALEIALERTDDPTARFHIRNALQNVKADQVTAERAIADGEEVDR